MRRCLCLPAMIAISVQVTACMASTPVHRASNPNIISAAELRGTAARNVYDAIQQLRPSFFATRGATSFLAEPASPIVVIVNQTVAGGLSELEHMQASGIRSIRRLNAAEVFNLTGRSAPAGGIEVLFGP